MLKKEPFPKNVPPAYIAMGLFAVMGAIAVGSVIAFIIQVSS